MEERKAIKIKSMRLAGKLMSDGFVLLGLMPNELDPRKHIFMFKDSELIRERMDLYLSR